MKTVRKVPYGAIKAALKKFIKPDYLPKKFLFRRPHMMTRAEIEEFFAFVCDRQARHGVSQAFRFMNVKTQFKAATLQPSRYPDECEHGQDGMTDNTGTTARSKPKKKKKQPVKDADNRPIEQVVRFENTGPTREPANMELGTETARAEDDGPGPVTSSVDETRSMDITADGMQGRPFGAGMSPSTDSPGEDYVDVDYDEMMRIHTTTRYVAITCNGPNDGSVPRYRIPQHIYESAARAEVTETSAPRPVPRPRPRGPLPTPQLTPDVPDIHLGVSTRQRSRAVAAITASAAPGPSRPVTRLANRNAEAAKQVRGTADSVAREKARAKTKQPARTRKTNK